METEEQPLEKRRTGTAEGSTQRGRTGGRGGEKRTSRLFQSGLLLSNNNKHCRRED